MQEEKSNDFDLPGIAFATLPATGETIAIRYGERIYYRVGTTKTAQELNAMYGVSEAQAKAMLARVLADWETPPGTSERYDPVASNNSGGTSTRPETYHEG